MICVLRSKNVFKTTHKIRLPQAEGSNRRLVSLSDGTADNESVADVNPDTWQPPLTWRKMNSELSLAPTKSLDMADAFSCASTALQPVHNHANASPKLLDLPVMDGSAAETVNEALKRARFHFLRVMDVERNRIESEWRLRLKQQDKQLQSALGVITSSVDDLRSQVLLLQRMLKKTENERDSLQERFTALRGAGDRGIDMSIFTTPTPPQKSDVSVSGSGSNDESSERFSFSSDGSFPVQPKPPSSCSKRSNTTPRLRNNVLHQQQLSLQELAPAAPKAVTAATTTKTSSTKSKQEVTKQEVIPTNQKTELQKAHEKIAELQRQLARVSYAQKADVSV